MFPDGPDVELLDTRPPRPGRGRWKVLGAVVVAAVAVGALVVAKVKDGGSSGTTGPSTRPGPTRPAVSSQPPSVSPAPAGVVSSTDLVFARLGDVVYAIDAGRLITVNLQTGRRREWPTAVPPADHYALLADEGAGRVWLVAATEPGATVESLDPTDLHVTGRYAPRGQYIDGAVLYGEFFAGTSAGVRLLADGAGRGGRAGPALGGQPLAMTADPDRRRVLATVIGDRSIRIGAWRGGRVHAQVLARSPIGKGDLVVAAGRIWAAGFGQHGVIAQLDPATLHVVRHSPLERDIGVGAVIVDSARLHLLVRLGAPTDGAPTDLWCVDAATGAVTRHWPAVAGTAVLNDHGVAVLAPGRPIGWLRAGACRG